MEPQVKIEGVEASTPDNSTESEYPEKPTNMALQLQQANEAMRARWKGADAEVGKHSMSFHLQHALRTEFFASYLYLLEKIPIGKKRGQSELQCLSHFIREIIQMF